MCKTTTSAQDEAVQRLQAALAAGALAQPLCAELQADIGLLVEGYVALKAENTANRCAGRPQATAPVTLRRMKAPADEGPFTGEALAQRMMQICGCKGQYDCDCVSARNLARIAMWTEHNTRAHHSA